MRFEDFKEGTRCWKGYKKKGMKTMFGKRVPNCVKNEANLEEAKIDLAFQIVVVMVDKFIVITKMIVFIMMVGMEHE